MHDAVDRLDALHVEGYSEYIDDPMKSIVSYGPLANEETVGPFVSEMLDNLGRSRKRANLTEHGHPPRLLCFVQRSLEGQGHARRVTMECPSSTFYKGETFVVVVFNKAANNDHTFQHSIFRGYYMDPEGKPVDSAECLTHFNCG